MSTSTICRWSATLAVLVFAVCVVRLVSDTLESRYQGWLPIRLTWASRRAAEIERYAKGLPRPIVSGTNTLTAPTYAIENEAELRQALAMLEIVRNVENAPFPSVRTDLNLREAHIVIAPGLRMAVYANEPGHPIGTLLMQVSLAIMSAWVGMRLGRRLEIDVAVSRFARSAASDSKQHTKISCLSTANSRQVLRAVRLSAWWMPACGVFAWYATCDRTGITQPYGSSPFASVLWNVICWGTWSGSCALTYLKVARSSEPAQAACLHCGYSLVGLTSGHCPECGVRMGTARSRRARLALGMMTLAIAVLTVGLGVRGAANIMGCQQSSSSDQSARIRQAALDASTMDRIVAWALISPVAPIRPRATFLASLLTPRDEASK